MQYWPRKRSSKSHARLRTHTSKDATPALMAGFKVGMTHVAFTPAKGMSKGQQVVWPVTVVEFPPLRVAGIALYKKDAYGKQKAGHIVDGDKFYQRIQHTKTKGSLEGIKLEGIDSIRLIVQTQPNLTGIGRKKPDVFEMTIGGTPEEQFAFAKEKFGKDISLPDVLQEGMLVDAHAVTTGKGFQGPVKRFGVAIRSHKSEKTKRGPGAIGPWRGGKMTKVPMAGQMGYHTRTERNKLVIQVGNEPEKINPKGGFQGYGVVKNPYALFRGSLPGPDKRLIKFTLTKGKEEAPALTYIKQ